MNSFNPSDAAGAAITPISTTVAASSLIAKSTPGNLYGLNLVAGASAGYFMLFDSPAVPGNGAVTPLRVWPVAANAGLDFHFMRPIRCTKGIVLMFSTTGPFTLTASATAFMSVSEV